MSRPHAAIEAPARRRPRPRERGMALIEAIGALFIACLMLIGISALIDTTMNNTRDQQMAQLQSLLATAANQFVQANYAALASSVTTTKPAVVPVTATSGLNLSAYLPPGLNPQNVYGQTPCLLVFASSTGGLDALLVTEGGRAIPDSELGYVAANAGPGAGSIPSIKPGTNDTSNSTAYGAYGSWTVTTPNPGDASCSGTPTGPGHLVSDLYVSAPDQNSDFLYRVGVPGYADANTMHVPIQFADHSHVAGGSDSECGPNVANSTGKVTTDASGRVLSCSSTGQWQLTGSLYWRDPVVTESKLPQGADVEAGDVSYVLDQGIPYVYTGSSWHSLIVDNAGNLHVFKGAVQASSIVMSLTNTIGDQCNNGLEMNGVGRMGMDPSGYVISCQNGTWQDQAHIDNASGSANCLVIMGPAGASDFSSCPRFNGPYPDGTHVTQEGNWYVYTQTWNITLSRPGAITASVWGHMESGYCKQTGYNGQLQQSVTITNNDTGNVVGNNWGQSPTLKDSTGNVTESLIEPLSPNQNGYTLQILTKWVMYSGQPMPYQSSICDSNGNPVATSPVAIGWVINSFY